MPGTPLVVQTEHLAPEAAAWLAARCRLEICGPDDARFDELLRHAEGLVIRTYTIVNQAMLDRAPQLRVVGRAGVGIDNIDVAACRKRGVEVVYTPDANTQAVVEYVVALLADALRPRVALEHAISKNDWAELREQAVAPRQMSELTLGVLGLGRVGRGVARAARGIGFNVLYHDLLEIPPESREGAKPVNLHELFETSNIVSLHVDGRDANRNFIDRGLLDRMKADAIVINTSRGFVIDTGALAEALRSRPHMLAMLDVHDPEPFGGDYPLLGLSNARLYPHLASRTHTAMLNMSWVVRDIAAVLEGRPPQFPAPATDGP